MSASRSGYPPDKRGVPRYDRKPNRSILVPPEIRPDVVKLTLQDLTRKLKTETGCDVVPHFGGHSKLTSFDIFGAGTGPERAVKSLNEWIATASTKSAASSAWAKMPAFDPNKWYYNEIDIMEQNRKQVFKGAVPQENRPGFRKLVDWPEDLLNDFNIFPTDALLFGHKLEHLDSIRVEEEVFISLSGNKDRPWELEIQGYDARHVEQGAQRYRTMIEKVRIRKLGGLDANTVNIVLDAGEGDQIQLQRPDDWWPTKGGIVPRLIYNNTMDPPGSFRYHSRSYSDEVASVLTSVCRTLDTLRFEQGSYDFAVRLGCVGLEGLSENEVNKKYPLKAFLKSIDSDIVSPKIKDWAFDSTIGDQVLSRLMSATQLLEPTSNAGGFYGFAPTSLEDTRPTLRGTWVLHDPNARPPPTLSSGRPSVRGAGNENRDELPARQLIVVQIDWTEDPEDNDKYEKMDPKFFKLPAKTQDLLDVNLYELGGGRAWHFGIRKMLSVPKSSLSPVIVNFAKSVQLARNYAPTTKSGQSFAVWNTTPSTKIFNGRLDKVYNFGIRGTSYLVEYQAMWYPKGGLPCWGLSVRHKEWPTHLAPLASLRTGCSVYFDNTVKTFFPDNGVSSDTVDHLESSLDKLKLGKQQSLSVLEHEWRGFKNGMEYLMYKLMLLSQVVYSGEVDDPARGVSLMD
ncbi:hypothetical protein EJ04DRAFT_604586 [Polyplosphaeria fusca]|uniref:DUF7905 domain-containing protein n=1 Tax=Polyplosphaeria fusca TaxID=682080 RepID=A0A9P4V4V1_9PLEO|nr:hypothetical protein EJ04DRAFT_604586 [Polyplosphaeria fusca]